MRISILHKILAGFLIIALIAGIAGAADYSALYRMSAVLDRMLDERMTLKSYADQLTFEATAQNGSLNAYLLTRDSYYKTELASTNERMNEILRQLRDRLDDEESLEQLDYLIKLNKQYLERAERIFQASPEQLADAARDVRTGLFPLGGIIVKFARQLSQSQEQAMQEEKLAAERQSSESRRLVVVVTIFNLFLSLAIGYVLWKGISVPLKRLSGVTDAVAAGDLTADTLPQARKDELGQLAESFHQMKESLRSLVLEIHHSVQEVMTVSREVSTGTEQTSHAAEHVTEIMTSLSKSAEMQVQNVERGLQEIYEMNAKLLQIDESSRLAMKVAGEAFIEAEDGEQQIDEIKNQMKALQEIATRLEGTMRSMQERSVEIGEINQMIVSIAAQTKLLALNAAIEAARAGEHGAGFTVVTGEIRKLANQTDQSAGQVSELVRNIQAETKAAAETAMDMGAEIGNGLQASLEVGEVFGRIRRLTQDTTRQIGEVSESLHRLLEHSGSIVQSIEQISGLSGTIATGSQQVARVTEEQLAFLQQNAAYATSLFDMAGQLQRNVRRFKV